MTDVINTTEGSKSSLDEINLRKCPICKSTRLYKDYKRAELSCRKCGFVLYRPADKLSAHYPS